MLACFHNGVSRKQVTWAWRQDEHAWLCIPILQSWGRFRLDNLESKPMWRYRSSQNACRPKDLCVFRSCLLSTSESSSTSSRIWRRWLKIISAEGFQELTSRFDRRCLNCRWYPNLCKKACECRLLYAEEIIGTSWSIRSFRVLKIQCQMYLNRSFFLDLTHYLGLHSSKQSGGSSLHLWSPWTTKVTIESWTSWSIA